MILDGRKSIISYQCVQKWDRQTDTLFFPERNSQIRQTLVRLEPLTPAFKVHLWLSELFFRWRLLISSFRWRKPAAVTHQSCCSTQPRNRPRCCPPCRPPAQSLPRRLPRPQASPRRNPHPLPPSRDPPAPTWLARAPTLLSLQRLLPRRPARRPPRPLSALTWR